MARVTGTQGNDDLLGTQGGDLVDALAGNDRILADLILSDALGGDDVVYAGFGDDQVYALGGDNRIYGENGRDTLITADGNDLIDAGPGDDPDVQAGRGNDRVLGRAGNDGSFCIKVRNATQSLGKGADQAAARAGRSPNESRSFSSEKSYSPKRLTCAHESIEWPAIAVMSACFCPASRNVASLCSR